LVSDYIYRISLIVMFVPPSLSSKINIPYCLKMALIYNMAEALIRDITPINEVLKYKKNQWKETTIEYFIKGLLRKVNSGIIGKEINNI
jgi:putative hydrolase of HD superfamily